MTKDAQKWPKLEKDKEPPPKFVPPSEDKYGFSQLKEPGDALFYSFKEYGDGTDQEEKNLRANLFFHIRKWKDTHHIALICRKDYREQGDDQSGIGFRVFYSGEEKPKTKKRS
jgi:hypothetical protein